MATIGQEWLAANYNMIINEVSRCVKAKMVGVDPDLIATILVDACDDAVAYSEVHSTRISFLAMRVQWRAKDGVKVASRSRTISFSVLENEHDIDPADAFDEVSFREDREDRCNRISALLAAMDRLTSEDRDMISVWMANDCNNLQTSRVTGIAETTIRRRVNAAIDKMKYWVGKLSAE